MKKKLLFLLMLCFALVMVVASCGDEEPVDSTTGNKTPAGEQHIHKFGAWSVIKEATCAEKGEQQRTCSCREKEKESIKALGHNYVNGKCSRCQIVQPISVGLEHTLSNDGKYYIVTGIGTCKDSEIYIRDSYEGKPVKEIGKGAFQNCKHITKVTLEKGVESVLSDAFDGCEKLIEVCSLGIKVYKGGETNGRIGKYAKAVHNELGATNMIVDGNGFVFFKDGESFYLIDYKGANKEITLPSDINGSGYSVYNYAFLGSDITSVSVGSNVSSIDASAFAECVNLRTVTIADGVTVGAKAFSGCISLESITLPSDLVEIGEATFLSCASLKEITIPSTVETIGEAAFAGCELIEDFALPTSINSIGMSAFSQCYALKSIAIPEGVEKIESLTFFNCTDLLSVSIPSSVKIVAENAFLGCIGGAVETEQGVSYVDRWAVGYDNSVEAISLRDGTVGIANSVFLGSSIKTATMPDTLAYVGNSAFYGCKALTSVTFGQGTKVINESAFAGCAILANVKIPASVTAIGLSAFDGCVAAIEVVDGVSYVDTWVVLCDMSVETVTVRDGTIGIADSAFKGKSNDSKIKSVTLPTSVKYINANAFYDCRVMETITGLDNVESIGKSAFRNCRALTSIILTLNVKEVDDDVFYDCRVLTINCEASEKPALWHDNWNPSANKTTVVWGYQG